MTRRSLVAVFAAALALGACVDHQENAREFCDRHDRLLRAERDGAELRLGADELGDTEREIERSMRDAEDGTRPVRRAARDLLDAYAELGGLVGDDDAEADELADAREDLLDARARMRAACADVV